MRFFKENSESIIKLFINQIGIAIFSMFMILAAYAISDKGGNAAVISIFISIFSILFYFVLIYNVAWEIGAKDKIRIDSGKMIPTPRKGLKMAILANVPNFLLASLAVMFMGIYMVFGGEWFYSAFFVLNMLIRFILAMFLGVIQGLFSFIATNDPESAYFCPYYFWQAVGYLVAPVLSILVTHFGYKMGSVERRLLGFIAVSKKK